MTTLRLKTLILIALAWILTACSPEVGSKEWCEDLKAKPKGEWTLQETADFAKHCVLP